MYDFKLNLAKNAMLCVFAGQMEDAEEAKRQAEKFREGIDQLEPGFTLVSDLSEFIPTNNELHRIWHEATVYAVEKGMGRAIRVVKDKVNSKVGSLQLNRSARELGYEVVVVASLDEALAMI